jgi:putative redox protein
MKAEVTWKEGLTFTANTDSGSEITLGSRDNKGESGMKIPSPMELIALGLAGCTAMDVISILSKKRQQVTGFLVQVHAERANEPPRVFTHIVLEYHITGKKVDEAAVMRSIELSATKYCPVHAMLAQAVPIQLKYYIYESGDHHTQVLLTSGEY